MSSVAYLIFGDPPDEPPMDQQICCPDCGCAHFEVWDSGLLVCLACNCECELDSDDE